LLRICQRHV